MDNETAVEILEGSDYLWLRTTTEEQEALSLAIEALEKQDKKIAYVCNGQRHCNYRSCKTDKGYACTLTTDIEFAANFKLVDGVYMEKK